MDDITCLKDQQNKFNSNKLFAPFIFYYNPKENVAGSGSYMECMRSSLFNGLVTFCLGFSNFYFAQRLIQYKFAYPRQWIIPISALGAAAFAYKAIIDRLKYCQAVWVDAEDNYLSQNSDDKTR